MAYKYQSLYHLAMDSINSAQNSAHLNELMVQYETEKKQRELVEMGLQQEKDSAALAEANLRWRSLLVGIVMILLIAILVVILMVRSHQTQRENAQKKC